MALAARGLKNMDTGDEAITDPRELDQVRSQSRAVHIRSVLVALVAAALGFGGIAGASAGIAKILFFVFLVLLLVSLVTHFTRGSVP